MPTAFDKRHLTYRKALLAERAARMRHWGTPSERRLWDCLTNGKRGVPFRRQYVIGNRIADFAAPSIRLVIEVDGAAHHGRARADARNGAVPFAQDSRWPIARSRRLGPNPRGHGSALEYCAGWLLESQVSLATFPQNDRDRERQLEYVAQVRRDVELASVEVLRRVGLSLSYRGLLRRFKTRCERFDVDFLREKLDQMSANGRREDFLTKRCAEYLFDQGLDPLFNASIAGRLRPDLFHDGGVHSLYIEAKQYTSRSDVSAVRKAAWQLWSTWSELEGPYNVREGFLLVFRFGGPLVVFEQDVRFSNRTLHPLLVDLAPGDQRGSAEKEATIHISAADMLPQPLV
jgi:very-short-patch-repair endonuclease